MADVVGPSEQGKVEEGGTAMILGAFFFLFFFPSRLYHPAALLAVDVACPERGVFY